MEKYEGWTNRETWLIALWIDNNQDLYQEWQDRIERIRYDTRRLSLVKSGTLSLAEATSPILADILKMRFGKDANRANLPSVWMDDLFSAALDRVNWQEIADHLLEV